MLVSIGAIVALAATPAAVHAATAQKFVPAAPCPTCASSNYVGRNNGTLPKTKPVKGKAFSRIIQVWLENTDYNVAASSPTFQKLSKQGITLSSYLSLTHPSEPNYIASMSGDFWGLADDNYYHVPTNITTVVDLLDAKGVSWATYQENMPRDAWLGDFAQQNYVNKSSPSLYNYYMRKHNPPVIHDSVTHIPERAARIRNFNDFAADIKASALPQWIFVTPNMVDDGHDTTIDYSSAWLEWWLVPLLKDKRFNSGEGKDGTLVVLTFDENSDYNARNNVYTILLGSAVPKHLHGTTDDTLYSHYSAISTVEGNWGLDNLGRGDVNKTMSNIFNFVADAVRYENVHVPRSQEPQTNITGVYSGPFHPSEWITFTAPPKNVSRFGGKTLAKPGLDWSITLENQPPPLNLTYAQTPAAGFGNVTYVQYNFTKKHHSRWE